MSDARLQALVDYAVAEHAKGGHKLPPGTEFKIGKPLDVAEQTAKGWLAIHIHDGDEKLVVLARPPQVANG